MSVLCLDIETVPMTLDAPGRRAIERMAEKREMPTDMFAALCPPLARVVAIGMLHPSSGHQLVLFDGTLFGVELEEGGSKDISYADIPGRASGGEAALLRDFMEICRGSKTRKAVHRFITFNGKGFDLPTLIHRAAVHEVVPAEPLVRAANAKPWEADLHVDLAAAFRFGGSSGRYSLEAFALGYGFANPKAEGDGSKLATYVEQKDAASLFSYVMGDVVTTARLYERWHALGLVPG